MLNMYTNAFRMSQLHNPAFLRENKASSKTSAGLHLLSQFYHPAGDGHTSIPAAHWQLGRSEQGRKSRGKSAQETRFHLGS